MGEDAVQGTILYLLDVVSAGVGRFEGVLDETRAGVGRLEERVGGLERRVEDLTTETRAGFDRVERRLGNIETRAALELRVP